MAGTIKLDGATFLEKDGGNYKISNTELKLKSSGNTIVDSSGNAVLSESGGNVSVGNLRLPASGGIKDSAGNNVLSESSGTVTVDNVTLGSSVSGIGQLIGTSYQSTAQTAGNQVTLASSKNYHVIHSTYNSGAGATYVEYTELSTDLSGNVTITTRINLDTSNMLLESTGANLVRIKAPGSSAFIANIAHIFEQGSTYDNA